MKIIVLSLLVLMSCNQEHKTHGRFVTIKIGGCEYIEDTYHSYPVVHKGDCANPIHTKKP